MEKISNNKNIQSFCADICNCISQDMPTWSFKQTDNTSKMFISAYNKIMENNFGDSATLFYNIYDKENIKKATFHDRQLTFNDILSLRVKCESQPENSPYFLYNMDTDSESVSLLSKSSIISEISRYLEIIIGYIMKYPNDFNELYEKYISSLIFEY